MSRPSKIAFIRVPVELLRLRIKSANDLMALALVYGFNGDGFRMAHRSLANTLHIHPRSAKRVIQRLADRGWVMSRRENGRRVLRLGDDIRALWGDRAVTGGSDRPVTGGGDQAVTKKVTDRSPPSDKKDKNSNIPPKVPQGTMPLCGSADNERGDEPGPAPAKPKSCRTQSKMTPYTADFERVWAEYPKKVGKAEAFSEWQKLEPDKAMVEQIIVSIRAWKRCEQWTKDNGKYIVHLCRFLKHRRFEDELPCLPEPQFGDPDWLPTEEELEARQRASRVGGSV